MWPRTLIKSFCIGAGGSLLLGDTDCGAAVDVSSLPAAAEQTVEFSRDIQPLLRGKCYKCHGPDKSKGDYRLDSRPASLRGGSEGIAIIPGNSASSPLIHYVAHLVEDLEMPPEGKGGRLSDRQVGLLRAWIDQGARWAVTAAAPDRAAPTTTATGGEAETSPPGDGPAAGLTLTSLPPGSGGEVDFENDIQPLLERSCMKCHGPEKPKGRFRLDNRQSALEGGSEGVAIIPGDSANSPLVHYIADLVEGMEMPPEGKGQRLSDEEILLVRRWIDLGAEWGEGGGKPASFLTVTPIVRWLQVTGNTQKFREQTGMRDEEWTAGIERFAFEHWLDPETRFTAEGRGVYGPEHYRLKAALETQDFGFIRGGVEHLRRYYNNYGGYYGPFGNLPPTTLPPPLFPPGLPPTEVLPQSVFRLDRDLYMDVGRVWGEAGLNLPRWPEVTVGYEYRYKDGDKSTLHWGPSTQGGETRFIYPAYKSVDEDVHIFRVDVRYNLWGFELEDNFLIEHMDLETQRFEASPLNFGQSPDRFTNIDETYDSTQIANTFSVQKRLRPWWLISGGHYYSRLDADATFLQNTFDSMGVSTFGQHWFSQPILIDWESHMFNASTRLGPWEGFTLSAGVQGNWEQQEGIGNSTLFSGLPDPMVEIPPFFTSTVNSNKQTVTTTEHATLRYDRIPFTVLFAQVELEQESADYFEHDPGVLQNTLRDSVSQSDEMDYRAGFTLSPWRAVSLNSHYRYRMRDQNYDHLRDENTFTFFDGTTEALEDLGYPGFILGRETETHEIRTRLNLRPTPWFRTLLTYQMQNTDYRTRTGTNIDPSRDPILFPLPSDSPGGEVLAGEYNSHIYSVNFVFTPCERLSLNSTFSLRDSATRTRHNGDLGVEDFDGRVFSATGSARFSLDKKTNLFAGYSYSQADFAQDGFVREVVPVEGAPPDPSAPGTTVTGLPLGIEYQQHSIQAGLSRQIGKNLTASLQYVYSVYDEPNSGGINDYVAHGVFAGFSYTWE